jgi:molybdopterin converting factor small subunit
MKILFFAQLQSVTGTPEWDLAVQGPRRAREIWQQLEAAFPGLSRWQASTRIARNMAYACEGAEFHDTDEIALIPPVSGG